MASYPRTPFNVFCSSSSMTEGRAARARARPSCSTGASGPFDDRRLRSTTFRARATLVLLLYRTFFGALIVLLRLEANLSGSTLTCRFTFICRFWVLLKVYRLIPSRTTVVRDFACFRVFSFFFCGFLRSFRASSHVRFTKNLMELE